MKSKTMEFEEAGWVLTADDAITVDDWIIEDGGEDDADTDERRRSISGILFPAAGGRVGFAPISRSARNPSLSFLPPSIAVVAASNGLVLLRGPWSSYYLCNPFTAELSTVPRPSVPHCRATAALVFAPNPLSEFHLVCAVDTPATFRFETYSSGTGNWRSNVPEILLTGSIVPESAVSAGGIAYWRTIDGSVVGFEPVTGHSRVFAAPDGVGSSARWQLGEAGDRLCCAVVEPSSVEVHVCGPADRWALVGSIAIVSPEPEEEKDGDEDGWVIGDAIVCQEPPWPLRFQSADPHAVLWVDGRVLVVDLASWRVRAVRIEGAAPDANLDDYVAHINTVASVLPQIMPFNR
ncbi:hypothetical protein J5N97_024717 [Dioscorea zingiberensis]|uniref:Uncharacterized protein n=1 Tax=Dioscorea zingiberensis TaxID=325984 RepID=A0A9D5H975_9LILI|nr:hypothetical protein J5N97_024717 [Dioscorea zingiberensis]